MAHSNPHKVYDVIVDASGCTVGGVLQQERRSIAYISRSLNPHEKNYPTHEQEVLALIYVIKKWRVYLENNPFKVYSDSLFVKRFSSIKQPSRRQIRWMQELE